MDKRSTINVFVLQCTVDYLFPYANTYSSSAEWLFGKRVFINTSAYWTIATYSHTSALVILFNDDDV